MNDDLQQLLKNLRLTKIAEILDEQVAAAETESLMKGVYVPLVDVDGDGRADLALLKVMTGQRQDELVLHPATHYFPRVYVRSGDSYVS